MQNYSKQVQSLIPKSLMISAILLLGACASIKNPDAPVAENYPMSFQKHIQASSHWAAIANDLSDQLQQNLHSKNLNKKPVYINVQSNSTEFTKAFNDFMITSLVRKNVIVSKTSANSIVYDLKVQTVEYKSHRNTLLPSKAKFTTLAAGLVVIRNIADTLEGDLAIIGAGALTDTWLADYAPKLELIITSSIVDKNIFTYRTSDIYYANNNDIHLYQSGSRTDRNTKKKNVFDDPFYKMN